MCVYTNVCVFAGALKLTSEHMRRLAPASNAPCNTTAPPVQVPSWAGPTPTSEQVHPTVASFLPYTASAPCPPEEQLSLSDLLADGVIEYVDVNEENNCLIALQESELTEGR